MQKSTNGRNKKTYWNIRRRIGVYYVDIWLKVIVSGEIPYLSPKIKDNKEFNKNVV